MGRRLQLQALLESVLGSRNVYFQPPATIQMQCPCIVYQREPEDKIFAGNNAYRTVKQYQVTVIDRNPDSDIPDKVSALPQTSHSRSYPADNLNHDVYNLFF